jgi:hypothetical protein
MLDYLFSTIIFYISDYTYGIMQAEEGGYMQKLILYMNVTKGKLLKK